MYLNTILSLCKKHNLTNFNYFRSIFYIFVFWVFLVQFKSILIIFRPILVISGQFSTFLSFWVFLVEFRSILVISGQFQVIFSSIFVIFRSILVIYRSSILVIFRSMNLLHLGHNFQSFLIIVHKVILGHLGLILNLAQLSKMENIEVEVLLQQNEDVIQLKASL